MKKQLYKLLSLLLAINMCAGIINVKAEENTYTKDESVYVILNSDGSVDNTTVTEWLHSDNGLKNVKDRSNLKDIKNISGEEKPQINNEEITWDSEATDIYYQGTSDKKLPISMDVIYKLDGNNINPKDLVGKSGTLEITISLKNNLETLKTINGKQEVVTTLFPVVMIMNMPNEQFTNVDVSSGTIISEGKNQVVTMTSVLGLNKALELMNNEELDKIKDKVNDTFTIKATVKDMDVPSIMLASTKVADEDIELNNVDFSELTNGISDLKDATNKILDGTVQLKNANIELNDKMGEFQGKINEFKDGVNVATDGSVKLQEGANALQQGITSLQTQVNALISSVGNFNVEDITNLLSLTTSTMDQVKEVPGQLEMMSKMLDDSVAQLSTIEQTILNGYNHEVLKQTIIDSKATDLMLATMVSKINEGIDGINVDEQLGQIGGVISSSIKVETNQDAINSVVQALVEGGKTQEEAIALVQSMTPNVSVDTNAINGAVAQMMGGIKEGAKANISNQLYASKDSVDEGVTLVADKVVASIASNVQTQLLEKVNGMQEMINQAKQLLVTMQDSVNKIIEASSKVNLDNIKGLADKLPMAQNGIQQLVDGSTKLAAGTDDMHNGMVRLQDGSNQVVDAVNKFKDATQKLAESTGELNDGVAKFSSEGIDKLDSEVNKAINELDNVVDIAKAYIDNTNDYTSYGDSVDGVDSSVKFIMKTKEIIKEKEEVKSEAKVEVETSFWDRVVNLFK